MSRGAESGSTCLRAKGSPEVVTCYLDFDGAMHHENVVRAPRRGVRMAEAGHSLFEWSPVLIEALRPYPGVSIVLSTSWVRVLGYDRAKASLPPELAKRVIGATFHRREHGGTRELREIWAQTARGVQIAHDLQRRRPLRWIAIDDAKDEFLPWQLEFLVACDGAAGLGALETQLRLRELLQKLHG